MRDQIANGYGGAIAGALRIGAGVITPAGIVAVTLFLAGLSADIDRNCSYTRALAIAELTRLDARHNASASRPEDRAALRRIVRLYGCDGTAP